MAAVAGAFENISGTDSALPLFLRPNKSKVRAALVAPGKSLLFLTSLTFMLDGSHISARELRSSTAPIDLDIGVEKGYDQWEADLRMPAKFGD